MIQGKKQVDIRENNKSAVINILLDNEMSLTEMATKLNLSHTALIKVTKELLEQDLIYKKDTVVINFGRPSAIYDINSNSAIASSILISNSNIEIYFVDMKGFQVNNITAKNEFEDVESLCAFLRQKVSELVRHPRIVGKQVHFLYIGLPSQGMYSMDFSSLAEKVKVGIAPCFSGTIIKMERDIDLILASESKYGVLKDFKGSVVVLKIDKDIIASLMIKGKAYTGDNFKQGQFILNQKTFTLSNLKKELNANSYTEIFEKYLQGDKQTIKVVHNSFSNFAIYFGNIIKFLDINKVVLCGDIVDFGKDFLSYCNQVLKEYNANINCEYVVLGKNAFRAGAVWLTTYHTLKEIVLRK